MDQQDNVVTGQPDIPDFNKQEIPKAVMSAEVLGERNVRRYTKKDGMFCKDFEHFFDKDTGKIDNGTRIIYAPTMTKQQAQEFITKLCEDTGRKVVIDALSGRPQAVPGWNLDIRVPGMGQSEQKAATVPEGTLRERLNNQLLMDQRDQINNLTQKLAYLENQMANTDEVMAVEMGGLAPAKELTEAQKKAEAKAKAKAEAEAAKKIINSK